MPYDFTSEGITSFQQAINTSAGTKAQAINDMQVNFKSFVQNNFNLTAAQIELFSSIPDDVTQNIGVNIANALTNNYTVMIDIGNFSAINPPNPLTTQVNSQLVIGVRHDSECHWTIYIALHCNWG